jgi:hypothetical protein
MKKKLNLGCDVIKLEGYVNADITERVNPDIVVPKLPKRQPFKDKEFDEVLFDNSMQYIKVIDFIPTLQELCRIGKKAIISINPKNKVGSAYFEGGMNTNGYSIGSLQLINKENSKRWRELDFGIKITKMWFELNFRKLFFVKLFEKWVNKSASNQRLYENSFLFYLFTARWIWIEIEDAEENE